MEVCSDGGRCTASTRPPCDAGIACTVDTCVEDTQSCEATPIDADGDGHPPLSCVDADGSECCSDFGESRGRCGTDCDDSDPTIAGLQPELCDDKDNDCDMRVDEEVACDGP